MVLLGGTCVAGTICRHVFGYRWLNAGLRCIASGVEHLLCRHEQGAAMAGYRLSRTVKLACIAVVRAQPT